MMAMQSVSYLASLMAFGREAGRAARVPAPAVPVVPVVPGAGVSAPSSKAGATASLPVRGAMAATIVLGQSGAARTVREAVQGPRARLTWSPW